MFFSLAGENHGEWRDISRWAETRRTSAELPQMPAIQLYKKIRTHLSLSGFFNSIKNCIPVTKIMYRLNSLKVFDCSYFLNIEKNKLKTCQHFLWFFFLSYCISYFTTVEFTLFVVKNLLFRGGVTLWVTGLLQNIHIANNLRGPAWAGYVLNWLVYASAWVGYVLNWLV